MRFVCYTDKPELFPTLLSQRSRIGLNQESPLPLSSVLWCSLLCSRARNWPLFWYKLIQPTTPYPMFLRSFLILLLPPYLNSNICNDLYISHYAGDSNCLGNIVVSQLHQTDSWVVSQIYFVHIKKMFVCFHVTGENEVVFSMCLPNISFHPLTLSLGLVILYINLACDTPWTCMGEYGHSSTIS